MIGRQLGNFRIVSRLDGGGMGEVWRAQQTSLGDRVVAIKVLAARLQERDESLARMRNEANIVATLRHAGIAGVIDSGETDGTFWIAFEFIDGETLGDRLQRGPLQLPEAAGVLADAADALAFAHARSVLHRDVKPSNIMIEKGGRVVLLDFGLALAKERTRLTPPGQLLGTPGYHAPEVLRGDGADHRSDVYALGVVAYQTITGMHPFRSDEAHGVMQGPLFETPVPPSQKRRGITRDWDAIVMRALAREPAVRFASAREFSEALRVLSGPAFPKKIRPLQDTGASTQSIEVARERSARVRRLAVLPFTAVGGGEGASELAEGFSETLAGVLTRYGEIEIIAPTATRHASHLGSAHIARELGADLVLSGSLQRAGSALRVTAMIVSATQATTLHSQVVDGDASELFSIQDRLTRELVAALGLALSARGGVPTAPDPLAHEHLLQARGYLVRFDDEAAVDGAVRLLEGLTSRGTATADVWAELARAYRHKYTIGLEPVWIERAHHASAQALELVPDHATALAAKASVDSLLGRHVEAEAGFRRATALQPANLHARTGLIELFRRQGRLVEAESECRSAIAARPADWAPVNLLGLTLFQASRYEAAIEAWRQVLRLVPDHPQARTNIGAALFQLGRFDDAEVAYREALEVRRSASAYAGLGAIHYYNQSFEESIRVLELAVALRPTDCRLWGNLALARRWIPGSEDRSHDEFAEAVRLGLRHLELRPRDAEVVAQMALWSACLGDLDGSTTWVTRALEIAPDDARTAARVGVAHEMAGRRAEAISAIARALDAGYGVTEFELDPELASLRESDAYRELLRSRS